MLVRDPLFIAVIMKVITGANLFHGSASKKNNKKTLHIAVVSEEYFRTCCCWKTINFGNSNTSSMIIFLLQHTMLDFIP